MSRLRDRLNKFKPEEPKQTIGPEPLQPPDLTPAPEEYQKPQQEKKPIDESKLENPYYMHKEVVKNPIPKGCAVVELCGRPIDFSMLEEYMVHKLSPKQMTAHMKFARSKTIEEIKGYTERPKVKFSGKTLWIIVLLFGAVVGGYLLMTTDISGFLSGLFGQA